MLVAARLMAAEAAQYGGSALRCLTTTVRTEGAAALYKGFIPSYTRLAPWQLVFFNVYEFLGHHLLGRTI